MFRAPLRSPDDVAPSPEFELIILCARTALPGNFDRRLEESLRREINWAALVRLAIDHQVLPLVNRNLRRSPTGLVPGEVMAEFQQRSSAVLPRNLSLLLKLFQVLALLSEAEIPCIPFKGPALAVLVYGGTFGLRPFGDLDILVPPDAHEKTRKLFLARGYREGATYGWESTMVDPTDGVEVDVHRAITPSNFPVRIDFAQMEERLWTLPVGGREIRSFGPEDMLIILCIQLAKDSRGTTPLRLSKVCDIVELLRSHPDLDWNQVVFESRRLRCEYMVSFALAFSHELLGAPGPDLELRCMPRRDHEALAAHVKHKMFNQMLPDYRGRLSRRRFQFKIRERWPDKVYPYFHDLRAAVRPSELDREFFSLPALLEPLYYLVRPVRVLWNLLERRRNSGAESRPDSSNQ